MTGAKSNKPKKKSTSQQNGDFSNKMSHEKLRSKIKSHTQNPGNGKVNQYMKKLKYYYRCYFNFDVISGLIFNPQYFWIAACLALIAEAVINVYVIQNVKYTEIDWIAYMQEVEGFLNGTLDYSKLKGDTGPLVYPAGFVYIFSGFYYLTNNGVNIKLAQYIFAAIYLVTLALVFRLFYLSKKIPPYVLIFICLTSYRIHSIFVLRLFNDCVAMLFLYGSLNMFVSNKWSLGSILFSLAVSIKMNVLLYAPALLMSYLYVLGIGKTIIQLTICASVQGILALPFLLANPYQYIQGAFNFGRVFLYEWTVNWKCIPESIFLSSSFHYVLLGLHVVTLVVFAGYHWKRILQHYGAIQQSKLDIGCQLFLLPMFISNFIGIVFCRSLHYQFYVWYYHTIHYLFWSTQLSIKIRILLLGIIEFCWTIFPAQNWSSLALFLCHFTLLGALFHNRLTPDKVQSVKKKLHKSQ